MMQLVPNVARILRFPSNQILIDPFIAGIATRRRDQQDSDLLIFVLENCGSRT
jgi:hypothetical protein